MKEFNIGVSDLEQLLIIAKRCDVLTLEEVALAEKEHYMLVHVLSEPKAVFDYNTANAWTEGYLKGLGITPSPQVIIIFIDEVRFDLDYCRNELTKRFNTWKVPSEPLKGVYLHSCGNCNILSGLI